MNGPAIKSIVVLILSVLALSSCAAPIASAPQAEDRQVTPSGDPHRMLALKEPMVFLDQGPILPASHGIRLPSGSYVLEAEDAQYNYFRAPSPIEYRIFQNGAVTGSRFMSGGLYLSKQALALPPAGAYLAIDDTHKTLTWKLGAEFLHLEGVKWTRSQ